MFGRKKKPAVFKRLVFAKTDVGRRRSSNEDAFYFDNDMGLYAVADGMGGHASGEVASQEALETMAGMVRRGADAMNALKEEDPSSEAVQKAIRVMESAVQAATYMVFALAEHDPNHKGMGTTVSALWLGGKWGITAQVGDSRVYLVRRGKVVQLTEDHTLIAWQLKRGMITEDQAALSPHKNVITRAVGSKDYVQVDTRWFETQAEDSFLVCSDGLHGYLDNQEVAAVMGMGVEKAVDKFIEVANLRGGKDNITAITVQLVAD